MAQRERKFSGMAHIPESSIEQCYSKRSLQKPSTFPHLTLRKPGWVGRDVNKTDYVTKVNQEGVPVADPGGLTPLHTLASWMGAHEAMTLAGGPHSILAGKPQTECLSGSRMRVPKSPS